MMLFYRLIEIFIIFASSYYNNINLILQQLWLF